MFIFARQSVNDENMDGLKNIEINNFRGIDHLKVEDFSRINVLVGQNNSGKTSMFSSSSSTERAK